MHLNNSRNERGANLVEYAFLVLLIVIIALAAITFLGTQVSQKFSEVGQHISNVQVG